MFNYVNARAEEREMIRVRGLRASIVYLACVHFVLPAMQSRTCIYTQREQRSRS